MQSDSMLLVLPVPFRLLEGKLFVEAQAANGLDRWADNFTQVTVAAPIIPESRLHHLAGFVWRPIESLQHSARITCLPLPWAYSPVQFLQHLTATRRILSTAIAQSQYLQFAIGGLIGDWAAIAALEAIKQSRRYAVHTDRVEHELIRKTASSAPPLRRLKIAVEAPLMLRYHRHLIRRCALGLWHGEDCFRAYSIWCKENHLIHDIHTKEADLIDEPSLTRKLEDIRTTETLHLCYTGRLDPMKAPLEWLRAIATARDMGANLTATWFGEGILLQAAIEEAHRLNLEDCVTFPGFIANRAELLAQVRAAHALVFTHITPESPRNLLEALVSGTPILGYDNPYAVNLLQFQGGGAVVPLHDFRALGTLIATLSKDRELLAQMTTAAARNGRRFTDTSVFAERSTLIKQFA